VLYYAIVFFLIAVLAGILGFGAIAGTAALIARVCFILFLVLFIAALLRHRRT
jgi:uncharacterized membrane protein YtjA (UPF0391 family)